MYQDVKRIRQTRVAINLDAYEARLIDAYVDYTGLPRAQVLRQLAMNAARETLAHATSMEQPTAQNEVRKSAF